ncbi:C-factor [Clathrospora elynae]|uniref:C-factor n=1 Tax=Clathrospora elynae TaxID=706981 RepID=A0A6A5SWQ4_9PLEO|nr:C-factor [Clathrospora elynae]
MSYTILITGAASGLGLAFLKHYASLPSPPTILAFDNQPFPRSNLSANEKISLYQVDITSEADLAYHAEQHSHVPITLLLHCAGVRGLVQSVVEREKKGSRAVAAAETLQAMDQATMLRTFEINTWGTFNTVKAFLPNLKLAASTKSQAPKVVILSSRMGSISANTTGGGYAYRASKAALNAVVKSFVVDVPEVNFLMLHPGRVETGLVEWKEEGAISVEESLADCLKVMEEMEKEDSGRLVDRFGVDIPW